MWCEEEIGVRDIFWNLHGRPRILHDRRSHRPRQISTLATNKTWCENDISFVTISSMIDHFFSFFTNAWPVWCTDTNIIFAFVVFDITIHHTCCVSFGKSFLFCSIVRVGMVGPLDIQMILCRFCFTLEPLMSWAALCEGKKKILQQGDDMMTISRWYQWMIRRGYDDIAQFKWKFNLFSWVWKISYKF